MYMDPFVALFPWLQMRLTFPGPLFCDTSETKIVLKVIPSKPLSSVKFTTFFRVRLARIGIGPSGLVMYSGHSIKRGSVQLYRSLGLLDENIIEKVQMTGQNA